MSSGLAPISVASITIGFISFSFTLAIWLHSFWDAFLTLGRAPEEVRDNLSTLRQGLYEEREYIRKLRKRKLGGTEKGAGDENGKGGVNGGREGMGAGIYYEGGPVRVISDAVKDLIRDFKNLERPFLETPQSRTGREKELEWSYDATQHYYRCDFFHRVLWLRNKAAVLEVSRRLSTIQLRRIAVEIAECHVLMNDTESMVRQCEYRLAAIERRL